MKKKLLTGLATGLFLIWIAGTSNAGSLTWTGAELNTQATWHTDSTHTTNGNSVDTSISGTNVHTRLFDLLAFSAGYLQQSDSLTLNADMTRLGASTSAPYDSDFAIGLTDGINYFSLMMADNDGGTLFQMFSQDANADGVQDGFTYPAGVTGTGMPAVNNNYNGQVTLSSNGTDTSLNSIFGSGTQQYTFVGVGLDLSRDIYIFGVGNDVTENYRINSLAITSTSAPVPEPATMLLMGTGLAGLIGARRKKKA